MPFEGKSLMLTALPASVEGGWLGLAAHHFVMPLGLGSTFPHVEYPHEY
jgi:hypothetical protein